jgi:hypothetical protein
MSAVIPIVSCTVVLGDADLEKSGTYIYDNTFYM